MKKINNFFINKKIVNNKLLFVSYEAVGLILNIHA